MTDAEIRDAAVAELKQTTVGYVNKKWKTPPAGTHWANALGLLAKIGAVAPPPPSPSGLRWAPPALVSPTTVRITGPGTYTLDDTKDYIIELAAAWQTIGAGRTSTTRSEIVVKGGRKRVAVGGSIDVQSVDAWDDAVSLHIVGGVEADKGGEFFVQDVRFPNSVNGLTFSTSTLVTLQGIRFGNNGVSQHDHSHGIHPDVIQIWRSPDGVGPRIRMDRFTGHSDYTFLSCLESPDPRSWEIRRTNLAAIGAAGDGLYAASGGQPHTVCDYILDDVWFKPGGQYVNLSDHWGYTDHNTFVLTSADGTRTWKSAVDQPGGATGTSIGSAQGDMLTCVEPGAGLEGQSVRWGVPAGGDFVA